MDLTGRAVTLIQNSRSGGPGLIAEYIEARGGIRRQTWTPKMLLENPPTARDFSEGVVVILGSPRGVYEIELPWVALERALTRDLLAEGVPVFGICFGAQLIATAIDGDVRPTGRHYQCWQRIDDIADPVWGGPWLRWHGDQVFLPPQAEVFARTGGIIQAFQAGSGVGVQFHPEVSASLLAGWLDEKSGSEPDTITRLKSAQDYAAGHMVDIRARAFALFDHVFGLLPAE